MRPGEDPRSAPTAIGWGRSEMVGTTPWALRVRWPLHWLRAHGAIADVVEAPGVS